MVHFSTNYLYITEIPTDLLKVLITKGSKKAGQQVYIPKLLLQYVDKKYYFTRKAKCTVLHPILETSENRDANLQCLFFPLFLKECLCDVQTKTCWDILGRPETQSPNSKTHIVKCA